MTGRFHVAAIAVRQPFGWWAMTRQDVREHLLLGLLAEFGSRPETAQG